jgi:Mce-associated membrane protein
VAVLSYSPDTLEHDFSAAEAHLTGEFLTYYRQFTSQVVTPAVRDKHITQTATVVRAGVESLTSQKAAILVFVNQTTTSQEKPSPATTASSVRVGLAKVNGAWLIERLDPV